MHDLIREKTFMRRLAFFAAASLGLGVAFIVDRPAAFAHCSDAECEKVCKTWDQKANNWKKKFNVDGRVALKSMGLSTDQPGFCKSVCVNRYGHPQDKYNRENEKRNCDKYLANIRCQDSCDNPNKKYNKMSDEEKKQWRDCRKQCDKKFPYPKMSMKEEMDCEMRRY